MGFVSILGMAHRLAQERVQPGDTVVDGTAGGGNDMLALVRLVGRSGCAYGFDVLPQAIARTEARLQEAGIEAERYRLITDSHERMETWIPQEKHGRVACVMFNLGYLPGGDHAAITTPATTLPALDAALRLLRRGGVLTVVVYPGHAGGREEADAVERWAASLPQRQFQSLLYRFANQRNDPPYLLAVEKLG
ncbi:MAG: SAM-dependent methyltransferase [Paenibacillaceae bacterium]|nr:SAM-dependent methyltransferase [Paenibacillaceae bacterium]